MYVEKYEIIKTNKKTKARLAYMLLIIVFHFLKHMGSKRKIAIKR